MGEGIRGISMTWRIAVKETPITTFAMMILTVFLCLGKPIRVGACTECICFSDATCSTAGCSESLTANCTRTEFSPSCDGNYTFTTYTTCSGGTGDCSKCQSCANLYKLEGSNETFLENCHTAECNIGNCNYVCTNSISLSATATYVMYVCKVPCPAVQSCESCEENCTAYACLSYAVTTCTP